MARKLATLEELVRALDDGAREFTLDDKLAALVAKAVQSSPPALRAELAEKFDRGRAKLERDLAGEIGDVPQKAKDMMREETLAAMEKLFAAVTEQLKRYQSLDGRSFVRS